jgi:opacity protein-like surface antigen
MKYSLFAGVISLGLLVSSARAQETYKNDATVSAIGSFEQSTSGKGINQSSTDSGGVLFTYRYFFTPHHGVELDYGYSRFSQQYTALGSTTVPFSGTLGIPADTHEATASYVFRFSPRHRFTPFLSAGTGALVFHPNSFTVGGVNGSTFATPDFVYSAGADIALSHRVSFRLGYRGHVFQAPDFGVPGIGTGSVTHMAEPFGGLSFHF